MATTKHLGTFSEVTGDENSVVYRGPEIGLAACIQINGKDVSLELSARETAKLADLCLQALREKRS